MSDPLLTPADLGVYLNDDSINFDRAAAMIADAQALCETVVSPLPAAAVVVVKRVAARGYVSTTQPRNAQLAAAGSPFGGTPGTVGGVWLSRFDKADLRRTVGGGGAFSVDTIPASYVPIVPYWDANLTFGFDGSPDNIALFNTPAPVPVTPVNVDPIKVYASFTSAPGEEVWAYPPLGGQIIATIETEPSGDKVVITNQAPLGSGSTVLLVTAEPGGTFNGQPQMVMQPGDSYTVSSDGTAHFALE